MFSPLVLSIGIYLKQNKHSTLTEVKTANQESESGETIGVNVFGALPSCRLRNSSTLIGRSLVFTSLKQNPTLEIRERKQRVCAKRELSTSNRSSFYRQSFMATSHRHHARRDFPPLKQNRQKLGAGSKNLRRSRTIGV